VNLPQQAEIKHMFLGEFPVANKYKETAGKVSQKAGYIIEISAFKNAHGSRMGDFLVIIQQAIGYNNKAGYTIGMTAKRVQIFPKQNVCSSKYKKHPYHRKQKRFCIGKGKQLHKIA
jgi:hypothetical protein